MITAEEVRKRFTKWKHTEARFENFRSKCSDEETLAAFAMDVINDRDAFQTALLEWQPTDLAQRLHAKFSLTGHLAWSEVESLLVELCGPLNRRKRCATCGGEGEIKQGWGISMGGTYLPTTKPCPSCEDGYTKGGE